MYLSPHCLIFGSIDTVSKFSLLRTFTVHASYIYEEMFFLFHSIATMPPPMATKQPAPPPAAPSGPRYFAVYDYTAADNDEISFNEGIIVVLILMTVLVQGL